MADVVDAAQELEALQLTTALSNRSREVLGAIGCCHYCQMPLSRGAFCDADCRDDYEKERRLRNRT